MRTALPRPCITSWKKLDIKDAVIGGESIGGSIALVLAARHNKNVKAVIAINPIGYGTAPLSRSSIAGAVFSRAMRTPLINDTVLRLRNPVTIRRVLSGAVVKFENFPEQYLTELTTIANRKGHGSVQKSVLLNINSFALETKNYSKIRVPALVLWGDQDWSYPQERVDYASKIIDARTTIVNRSGHFMTMDRPDVIISEINSLR